MEIWLARLAHQCNAPLTSPMKYRRLASCRGFD
jgi:hypothetical protein